MIVLAKPVTLAAWTFGFVDRRVLAANNEPVADMYLHQNAFTPRAAVTDATGLADHTPDSCSAVRASA